MGDNIAQTVGDKLNKDNYHIWSYRIENFLMGKGLWGLVNGHDECPELRDNPNILIPYIMKASTTKEAWDIIHKIYGTLRGARKIHLKQKLHSVSFINCKVKDYDMVSLRLNGLGPHYKSLDTSISVRGTMLDFDELVALRMIEEVKNGLNASRSGNSRDHAFFSIEEEVPVVDVHPLEILTLMDMPRGRGRSNLRGRGRLQAPGNYYHCDKYDHFEKDCYY
ncbi:hypothetical protein KP509_1Z242700 [Ceratopteris richardii]|nr:hypothetical protein KP509_1Z242700 [Ceratopteris richardii]